MCSYGVPQGSVLGPLLNAQGKYRKQAITLLQSNTEKIANEYPTTRSICNKSFYNKEGFKLNDIQTVFIFLVIFCFPVVDVRCNWTICVNCLCIPEIRLSRRLVIYIFNKPLSIRRKCCCYLFTCSCTH